MHYRLKINIFWILEIVNARGNLIVDADMQKHLKWAVTFMKSCYYLIFGMKRQFNIACVVFEKDKMLILKQAHSRPSYEICLTFCFLSITKIFSLKTFTTKAIKRGRFRILNNTLNKYLLRSMIFNCIIDIITINKNETI